MLTSHTKRGPMPYRDTGVLLVTLKPYCVFFSFLAGYPCVDVASMGAGCSPFIGAFRDNTVVLGFLGNGRNTDRCSRL